MRERDADCIRHFWLDLDWTGWFWWVSSLSTWIYNKRIYANDHLLTKQSVSLCTLVISSIELHYHRLSQKIASAGRTERHASTHLSSVTEDACCSPGQMSDYHKRAVKIVRVRISREGNDQPSCSLILVLCSLFTTCLSRQLCARASKKRLFNSASRSLTQPTLVHSPLSLTIDNKKANLYVYCCNLFTSCVIVTVRVWENEGTRERERGKNANGKTTVKTIVSHMHTKSQLPAVAATAYFSRQNSD